MSDIEIKELVKKLKFRKLVLQEQVRGLTSDLTKTERELNEVIKRIEEIKPLQDYVYAKEYLDSLQETVKKEGE